MEASQGEAKARKKHAAALASHRTKLPVAVEGMPDASALRTCQ